MLFSLQNECTGFECLWAVNDELVLMGPFLPTCNNSLSLSTKNDEISNHFKSDVKNIFSTLHKYFVS